LNPKEKERKEKKRKSWVNPTKTSPKNYPNFFGFVYVVGISVACVVSPSVRRLPTQLNFPSKIIFCNLIEFPMTKKKKTQNSISLAS
jgi:hypothetical protein